MPPKTKRLESKDFSPKATPTERSLIKRTPFFDVKFIFNNKNKFACVVKKNIFGKAVLRNKTRRKVYSIIYTVFNNEKYSVIAYPRKQSLTTRFEILQQEALLLKKEIK